LERAKEGGIRLQRAGEATPKRVGRIVDRCILLLLFLFGLVVLGDVILCGLEYVKIGL